MYNIFFCQRCYSYKLLRFWRQLHDSANIGIFPLDLE